MSQDFIDIDPNHVAAVIYQPDDDVDTLLADFARDLVRRGQHVGGVVQVNIKDETGKKSGMSAIDLMSGDQISICQPLGSGSMACKLDSGGLADAARAVTRAVQDDVALVVINKFSKQEATGRGLRSEFAEAILAGVPVLTGVPEKCLDAWIEFTGDRGTTLLCERSVVEGWWEDVSSRMARRGSGRADAVTLQAAATFRSSHPTI